MTTRIGIIGTRWGLMHVGAFRAAGAQVVALCGRSPESTRAVAEREGIPLATTEVHELCAAVDAVVVASPDAQHATHLLTALEAGRAVLCEKPLTRTVEDARRVVLRARALSSPSAVNFPYRMLPPVRALKSWLSGRKVQHLVVTLRTGFVPRHESNVEDASGDWGGLSHVLDAALWLTDATPLWVQATLSGRPIHTAALHVGLSNGAVLVLTHAACAEPGIHGGWSLLGQDWEVGFSAGYVPAREGWCISPIRGFEHGGWSDVAPGAEPHPGQLEPWAQAHVETARRFLGLRGHAPRDGLATVEDGALVQEVLAAALRSDSEGRRVPMTHTSKHG
ncbi:Gfo/Idh/MocA family oxidoreductase [Myxococcus sp. XM-1-1-1]|uniref:Gfo/Idh/MocA family protein n=1 Tax=Myxococcus sp. XM-1-1-1 TaxID=2874602 RepID=UPI001CBEC2B4|nr:Gfo/Idh/MocA family oxidoreductase [Myxococcus sp. XM-1-1-1]MBZ4413030.1 Gfo/Idh/MocA family oxidoreductase [Myxococcus sp. XM-1-1-1]